MASGNNQANGIVEGSGNAGGGNGAGPFGMGQAPGVRQGETEGQPKVFGSQNLQQKINQKSTQSINKYAINLKIINNQQNQKMGPLGPHGPPYKK